MRKVKCYVCNPDYHEFEMCEKHLEELGEIVYQELKELNK